MTVMFFDTGDFTPFAEWNMAEGTVSRLNELFEIVVPAVGDGGQHVNKFLDDGAPLRVNWTSGWYEVDRPLNWCVAVADTPSRGKTSSQLRISPAALSG
jgi:class 3 adenylate cyclase